MILLDIQTLNTVIKALNEQILKYPVPPDPNATPETLAASNALLKFMERLSE